MASKPLVSQTKAARIARQDARNAMYETVLAMSHSDRYLRGMLLRGNAARTPEEDQELKVNTIVTGSYDQGSTADGFPVTVSDVMRGLWKAKARIKFSEMAAKDPSLLAGYAPNFANKYYKHDPEAWILLVWVESEITALFQRAITTICDVSLCELREATGKEHHAESWPDKWIPVFDNYGCELTELLIRPRAKSRQRVKGKAVIAGRAFVDAVYKSTSYRKLFGK